MLHIFDVIQNSLFSLPSLRGLGGLAYHKVQLLTLSVKGLKNMCSITGVPGSIA